MKERNLLLAVAALVIVIAAAFALASPRAGRLSAEAEEQTESSASNPQTEASRRPTSQLCTSSAGYQQLKSAAFDQAIRVRGEPANLTRLAATSVIRMENPVVTSEDGADFAACSGRLVIELPPGAERGAGGERRIAADVEYTAQSEAGGGVVYRLTGGDAIVSSLAAFDIDSSLQAPPPAVPAPIEVAQAPEPAEELPVIIRADPADRPIARPAPVRPTPRVGGNEAPSRAAPARPSPPRSEREEPAPRAAPATRPTVARAERDEPRPATARPSFSCSSARSRSERAICASDRLAAKDRAMSRLFFSALDDADPRTRSELQRTRNRFLAYRDRCASDACISQAYDGRVEEIRDIMAAAE